MNIRLTAKQRRLLEAYRQQRRVERGGKVIQTATAVSELIDKALSGVEPARQVSVQELVARIEALERKVADAIPNP